MSFEDRKLFVVTFIDEGDQQPPLPEGQQRTINVPAFVESIAEAERKALIFAEKFHETRQGKLFPNAKLVIQSIVAGGTLLT